MKILICYDVPENKIRTKVAHYLESIGHRIQYSVFLIDGDSEMVQRIEQKLQALVQKSEKPALLAAPLCRSCSGQIWQLGTFKDEKQICIVA